MAYFGLCYGGSWTVVRWASRHAGVSEAIARQMKSKGISTSFTSRGSMREILVKPKDQLEKEQDVGVLNWIGCAGANSIPCPDFFIGETEITAAARFQEHTSTATNALGKYKSAMLHAAACTRTRPSFSQRGPYRPCL